MTLDDQQQLSTLAKQLYDSEQSKFKHLLPFAWQRNNETGQLIIVSEEKCFSDKIASLLRGAFGWNES